ncbi:unnamed protein product [Bathycoccus prasinos]
MMKATTETKTTKPSSFTLDDLMLGRVHLSKGENDEEEEEEEHREIVFSYPLLFRKKKKQKKESGLTRQREKHLEEEEEEFLAKNSSPREKEGAQNMTELLLDARRRDDRFEQQREMQMQMQREHVEKMVTGFPYAKKHQQEQHHGHHRRQREQEQEQQRASPRHDTGNAPHEQQQEEQNALTSPPRRITLQPSPLKASNQRPEASPGMRALGLSPSPVKQIENNKNDRNRQQQEIEDDETMKETLEYRGGYVDAHPKIEKPPSPPRGFFRKIDSVASDEKQQRRQQQQNDEDDVYIEPRGAHRRKSPSGGVRASESTMTIDVPSKKNGARKGRRESEELRLEASKILGITPPPSQKYGGHHPRAIVATLVSNNDYQYRLDESSDFEDGRRRSSRANKNFPARPYWETNTARYEEKRKLQEQSFDMDGDGSNDNWIGGLTDERSEKMYYKRVAYANGNGSVNGQQPPRRKKRGRPPGTKNPPNAKKTGPKTKKTVSANNSEDDDDGDYRSGEEKPKKKRGRPVGWRKYAQQDTQEHQQHLLENHQRERRRYEEETKNDYDDKASERSHPVSAPPSEQKRPLHSQPPPPERQQPQQIQPTVVQQMIPVVPSLQPPLVDNPTAASNEKACLQCKRSDHDYALLVCGGCTKCFHTFCLVPQVSKIPDGDWFCYDCVANGRSVVKKEEDDKADEAPGSSDSKKKKKKDATKEGEEEEVKVKKKPGPKPGSKRRPDAKKPGPKPRKKTRHRAYSSDEDSSSSDEGEAVGWTRGGQRVVQGKSAPPSALKKGHSIDEETEEAEEDVEEDDVAINNSKTVWSFEELVALENARATVKKDENYWQNIARRIPVEQNCAPKTAKECRQRVYEGMPSETR